MLVPRAASSRGLALLTASPFTSRRVAPRVARHDSTARATVVGWRSTRNDPPQSGSERWSVSSSRLVSADLTFEHVVGGVDERGFLAGGDGRTGRDVVTAAVTADGLGGLAHHD